MATDCTINISAVVEQSPLSVTATFTGVTSVNGQTGAVTIETIGEYLTPSTITFADPFTVDVDNGTVQTITLTASTTLTAITNATAGQSGRLEITQGGIGGFVVTLPVGYTLRSGDEATISDLATGETAIMAWSTIDGSAFNLWIS